MGSRLRECQVSSRACLPVEYSVRPGAVGCSTLNSIMLPAQGFTDFMAAIMVACFGAGCCLGSFLGGAIGTARNSGKALHAHTPLPVAQGKALHAHTPLPVAQLQH